MWRCDVSLSVILQYPPADAVSYGGDYLGEPSPKRICMKPDPALDHPTCPLSYSQANPVYSEASPASASSGSSLNIEDETQHSPCHHSPAHIGERHLLAEPTNIAGRGAVADFDVCAHA